MAIAISIVILILSVIAHEVAHGYAADALGDPTARYAGRLTLNPIPHIDILGSIFIPTLLVLSGSPILFGWAKPVPYNPYNLHNKRWGETLVALAGVGTNLVLALFFSVVIRVAGGVLGEEALALAGTIVFINIFLALFNLIPFPPLDGFTALRSALPWHLGRNLARFEEQIRATGFVSLILFLLVFSLFLSVPFFNGVLAVYTLFTGSAATFI